MEQLNLIGDIPQQARYSVLSSLVSSINCGLIGSANSIVRRVTSNGTDIREVDVREVELLLSAPDDEEDRCAALETPRALYNMRTQLVELLEAEVGAIEARDKLLGIKRERPLRRGDMHESIQFMSTPFGHRENAAFDRMALAAGMSVAELADSNKEAAIQQEADAKLFAAQIKAGSEHIEWVIDHVFSYGANKHEFCYTDANTGEIDIDQTRIESLPPQAQASVLTKLRNAVAKAKIKAFTAMQRGSTLYEFSDIFMFSRIAQQCEARVNHLATSE